jgi:hypothetical protein
MRKGAVAVAILLRCVLSAQDIAGDWQGTLKFGKNEERVVISPPFAVTASFQTKQADPRR